jgi:hypothetical protein
LRVKVIVVGNLPALNISIGSAIGLVFIAEDVINQQCNSNIFYRFDAEVIIQAQVIYKV